MEVVAPGMPSKDTEDRIHTQHICGPSAGLQILKSNIQYHCVQKG